MPKRSRYYDDDGYGYDDDFDHPYGYSGWDYAPAIQPADGIKAKSQRGAFASSWWAKRWIAALEQFGWGNRLTRGRNYARKGQVVSIDIKAGFVVAKVQGSRPSPYNVRIGIAPFTDAQWEQAVETMASQAIYSAQLLAGEMPQDIEGLFEHTGFPLFPVSESDIDTRCSCPDYANPCKHIAAVYYLLGEQFDEDPFLIFQLRGRTREQIMSTLQARRADATDAMGDEEQVVAEPVPSLDDSDILAHFYEAGADISSLHVHIAAPDVSVPMLRRLGKPPADTNTPLQSIYQSMTAYALDRVFGERTER